ncbi:MAG: Xaa-Pro aminopeptidase [Myxococcota bacterium]|jgi:Xaa-Pro aminopeptidase
MTDEKPDFAGRRHRVFERLGPDVLLVAATPLRFKSGDTDYEYRPNSDLIYLAGVDDPGAVLILCGHAEEERTVLFLPEADARAALWSGARTAPDDAVDTYGVDAAYGLGELEARFPSVVAGADRLFYRWGTSENLDRHVRKALTAGLSARRRTGRGPVGVLESALLIDELRLLKDPIEVEAIRAACAVTIAGHRAGIGAVAPGAGEWAVEAQIEVAFRSGQAFGPAFSTIVGSGANACVLHYTRNDRTMQAGELVLMDAGAELSHYCGDITRTVPVSGTFTGEQRALYDVVEAARAAGVAACGPGVACNAPHDAALQVIVEGLVELGVASGSHEEVVESGRHGLYMPHKTSHWLGLDVHDVGDYVVDGAARVLEPGMVMTIEPGLYFSPQDESVPEALRGLGVRIEDDVLITATGHENLTEELPTDPLAIEALMVELQSRPFTAGGPS